MGVPSRLPARREGDRPVGMATTETSHSRSGRRSDRTGRAERAAIEALSTKELDILVVGGGSSGRAPRSTRRRAGCVGIVEQRDWGKAAPEPSSKLIHGASATSSSWTSRSCARPSSAGPAAARIAPHLVKPSASSTRSRPRSSGAPTSGRGWRSTTSSAGPEGGPRRPAPPAPEPPPARAGRAEPQAQRLPRRPRLLRRPGRRRPLRLDARAHRVLLRRPRGEPGPRRGLPQGRRARRRRAGARPGGRAPLRDPRQAGRQRDRRMDGRHAGDGRRARAVQGARLEGRPPRRAADRFQSRPGCCCAPRRACCSSSRGGAQLIGTTDTPWNLDKRIPPRPRPTSTTSSPTSTGCSPKAHPGRRGHFAGLRPLLAGESDETPSSREHRRPPPAWWSSRAASSRPIG